MSYFFATILNTNTYNKRIDADMAPQIRYKQGNIIKKVIFSVVALLTGIELGDTVVTIVDAVNTTAWTFTGNDMVESVIDLIPLMYYGSVVVGSAMAFLYTQ